MFQDRLKRVQAFLDEYYVMIHRAAGWDALRLFLLVRTHVHLSDRYSSQNLMNLQMLLANRLITVSQVSKSLRYYEKLVGMDTWYT